MRSFLRLSQGISKYVDPKNGQPYGNAVRLGFVVGCRRRVELSEQGVDVYHIMPLFRVR